MDVEQELSLAIAELLHVHAECLQRFDTERPEDNAMLGGDLIGRMHRQRAKLDASFDGPPEVHVKHVRALAKGMRACMRRLQEIG